MRSGSKTHARARARRRLLSPPEAALWARLRHRDETRPALRRQHPVGPFIADFYCAAARLVIEIDGAVHEMDVQEDHDVRRDAWMAARGYRVIRFPAVEVMVDPDEAALSIVQTIRGLMAEDKAARSPPNANP